MPALTADALNQLRSRTDPLADAAVAALEGRGKPGETVLDRVQAGAARGNPAMAAFIEATQAVPRWVDFPAMELGRRAAVRNAPLTYLVLSTASLIESFAGWQGAKVLARTGRLERDTLPRLFETAAMVRDLLVERGAIPGGPGHTALLKVRLLHAHVRRFIRASPTWDAVAWGEPINQMDMVGTLLMFSMVLARGLESLGVGLTTEEKASWNHLWHYAGFMLGVDEEATFTNLDEEHAIYALIREHHYHPDETSRSLAFAVLDSLAGQPPFFLPKPALYALARHLLGQPLADQFELPRARRWAAFVSAFSVGWRGVDRVQRKAPFGKSIALAGGHAFVELSRWQVRRFGKLDAYVFRTARH
jgi:hypothetical protein